jgi:hypothetical protein
MDNSMKTDDLLTKHLMLEESLACALQHPDSAISSWMMNLEERMRHMRYSANDDFLYWADDENQKRALVFPAILNLRGRYGRLDPYFSLVDHETVCF